MWTSLNVCIIVMVIGVQSGEVAQWQQQKEKVVSALFHQQEAAWGVEVLQQAARQGNLDAESDLTLARLLGTGMTQDIAGAAASSSNLVNVGGARAHTTQGLLLSHNLTGTSLTKEERHSQAVWHYLLAAMNKDPLAQIMMGGHYWNGGDCEAALQYLRRAAVTVIPTAREEAISQNPPRYLWAEDDNTPSIYQMPSLDEFQFLEYSAMTGDPVAALRAGIILHKGVPDVGQDLAQAAVYLRQAAQANSTSAMVMLAAMHLHNSVAPDRDDTLDLLQTALILGDKTAHTYLGLLYLKGFGDVPKNLARAKKHLEQGIRTGSVEAFYLMGNVYEDPDSSGSPEEAMMMWEVSATFGHVPSAFRVAENYWQNLQKTVATTVIPESSSAVSENLCRKALPLYRMISLSGSWQYLQEAAYEDYTKGRYAPALLKYLLLSDLGYASAHVNAGRLLDSGITGVYSSIEAAQSEALKVWGRAAEAGVATGHLRLGDIYYYGEGVPRDLEAAATHYGDAGKLGSAHALFNMANMIEWGVGVSQNVTNAKVLYEAAYEAISDAYVPVSLALLRMDLFLAINSTLGFDLYYTSWSPTITRHTGLFSTLDANIPAWDIVAMVVLATVIVVMITARHRR
ncbi:protein sel-1 homolog 2-like [Homarus americanus]|uniref:Sel-1 2-like n=1 Tax=Homarus americanus TaxID=6706 RepID=A0A8J5TIQ7_HOMAM|nr:protein sel-1 homolog 2-like [Homarus americanus]KAG7175591.1 sel-1 2-like [Homarus americanus]